MTTPSDPHHVAGTPPPGYGPPPPGYPQGPPPPGWSAGAWVGGPTARPTNTLAIVSLVLIFVFPPAALVTGIIARKEIKQTGEAGDGMALAGVICGALSVALFVFVIGALVLFAGAATY